MYVKSMEQLKTGDTLIHKKTKNKFTISEINDLDVTEGKNFYFKNFGYVRFRIMRKMFETDEGGKFILC